MIDDLYHKYSLNKLLYKQKNEQINRILKNNYKPTTEDINDAYNNIKFNDFLISEYMLYICGEKLTIYNEYYNCSSYDILLSPFMKFKSGFT